MGTTHYLKLDINSIKYCNNKRPKHEPPHETLHETAIWLISMLGVNVSLWHGGILNLSLNDQFAPVESCIGVTDSGCSCVFV